MVIVPGENGEAVQVNANDLTGYPYGTILVADGNELDCRKAVLKIKTKYIAKKKILDIIPQWKQNNLTARATELLERKIDGTITATEQTELTTLRNTWNSILKPIRTASDSIENEINGIATTEEANAYNVEGNPLWP